MIVNKSHRHSSDSFKNVDCMWNLPSNRIIEQASHSGSMYWYLIYKDTVLVGGTTLNYDGCIIKTEKNFTKYVPNMFKESDFGTILTFTQE